MSDVGKIPNPINPSNDPKKDKHNPLDPSQYGRKFDYRKQDRTQSGRNKNPFLQGEEEPSATRETEKPTPDSIFRPVSPDKTKNTLSSSKNPSSNDTKGPLFSNKNSQKEPHHSEIASAKKSQEQQKSSEELSNEKSLEQQELLKGTSNQSPLEKHEKKKKPISANPIPETTKGLSHHEEKKLPSIKNKEEKKEEVLPPDPPLTNVQLNQVPYQPPILPTGSAFIPYQISQLFDRMVGIITVMDTSGIKTTEFTLSGEEFASSVFYGARITITEYSTAPKAFNVQLSAGPKAIALFQENMPNLLVNFASNNYAFRINRLETSLIEERPLFKRKRSSENDQQPKQGDS